MKALTQSSLLFWLCCFICGMTLSLSDSYVIWVLLMYLLFLSNAFFPKFFGDFRSYLLYGSLIFLLGGQSIQNVFPRKNLQLEQGENYYVGTIEMQIQSSSAWSTNLVRLHAVQDVEGNWIPISEKVLVLTERGRQLVDENDVILFQTQFAEISLLNNPGEFDAPMYWKSKGIRYRGFGSVDQVRLVQSVPLGWFKRVLNSVREYSVKILDQYVGDGNSALIKAILLGDKSDLDVEVKRKFMNTGAMHMLAVSGMHVGLIVVILNGFFRLLFFHRGRVYATILMVVILWFYAFLTGFSASVTRAVAMFTVIILANVLRRGYQPVNSLCIAAFFIFMYDPMQLFDIGFQLSFLAMLGIFTFFPLLESIYHSKYRWLNTFWQGTAIGLASQAFTVPISLYYFHQFPNYFLVTNIGVMLFSGVILGFAIALLVVGKIPLLSSFVGWILAVNCSLLIGFIGFVESIPGAVALGFSPNVYWLILCYIVVLAMLYFWERRNWRPILMLWIPILFWLQWDRYINLNKREWIVFNDRVPIIVVSNGDKKRCFYMAKEMMSVEKLRPVVDYLKIHPGSVEMQLLSYNEQYSIDLDGIDFKIQMHHGWIEIKYGEERFAVVTSFKTLIDQFDSDLKVLTRRNTSEENVFNLSEQSFRRDI